VFELGVPILGICYGLQEIARTHGGNVEAHTHKEYGYAKIEVQKVGNHGDRLFEGIQMEEDGGMQVSWAFAVFDGAEFVIVMAA
jgi:GMP synthase (glutamine-hydrolysing)